VSPLAAGQLTPITPQHLIIEPVASDGLPAVGQDHMAASANRV
jgi:hypothetical protein